MAEAAGGFSLTCANHPERAGVAICVLCRRTVCSECTTRFQGINHCSACVAGMARRAPAARPASPAVETAGVALAYLVLATALYLLGAALAP